MHNRSSWASKVLQTTIITEHSCNLTIYYAKSNPTLHCRNVHELSGIKYIHPAWNTAYFQVKRTKVYWLVLRLKDLAIYHPPCVHCPLVQDVLVDFNHLVPLNPAYGHTYGQPKLGTDIYGIIQSISNQPSVMFLDCGRKPEQKHVKKSM